MVETGMLIAYTVIGAMAVGPIYFGSFNSLDRLKGAPKKKDKPQFSEYSDSEADDSDSEESESVSAEDAYMFPIYGSATLFSLYLVFKYINPDWVNLLLSGYFALLGVASLTQVGSRAVKALTGVKLPLYHVNVVYRTKSMFDLRFTNLHIVSLVVSALITAYYIWTKNWVASNLFGLAFSVSAVSMIRLDSFKTGMIMLGGLFLYDIFWVFGTEVMVSVAKNFDAPIKVVFPKEIIPSDGGKLQFTMLGLGDIVVPGIFVALCLRFDRHLYLESIGYEKGKALPKALGGKRRGFAFPTPYFNACIAAYVAGLVTTITVMHTFKAAQPALLYLSPACTLSVIIMGLTRGQIAKVFAYSEETPKESDDKKSKKNDAEGTKNDDEKDTQLQQQPAHRYNLRNHTGSATPASGGELADDEGEVGSQSVLEEKIDPISNADDAKTKQTPRKRKTKAKNSKKQ